MHFNLINYSRCLILEIIRPNSKQSGLSSESEGEMTWDESEFYGDDEVEFNDSLDDELGLLSEEDDDLICSLCHSEIFGDDYTCEQCGETVCKNCYIPGVDEYGNIIFLCKECAEDSGYGQEDSSES